MAEGGDASAEADATSRTKTHQGASSSDEEEFGEIVEQDLNNVEVVDLDARGEVSNSDEEGKEDEETDHHDLQAEFPQEIVVQRLEDGSKLVNEFKKLSKLASGGLCSRMKTYYTGPDGRMAVRTAVDDLQREVDLLAAMPPHDSLCRLLQVLDDEEHHKTYLVFPYYGGGCLMHFDSANFTFWHAAPQARALAHLHAQKVVHRDVKPANVLLSTSRQRAILCDLGSGKQLSEGDATGASSSNNDDTKLKDTEGTYPFFSPEMCRGEAYDAFAADVWSLGVSVYVTVYSVLPYFSISPKDLFDLIGAALPGQVPMPDLENAAENPRLAPHVEIINSRRENGVVQNLLRALLHPDPSKRPTAEAAADMLSVAASEVAVATQDSGAAQDTS
ncbi:Protein kinase, putative [Hondaea fermentalgiana]|uniref:Protein kinase, putative n=1 Tax=Hondaea fermentalgiana TaxID=2315210 RepID=A0A2R5GRW1_9STRA|nr:Protein kinase, putative [Hondaea fermentalgiana]|eukprot:GBG31383.1 Protein kinase, putative [Hondaea fermentalgiana]